MEFNSFWLGWGVSIALILAAMFMKKMVNGHKWAWLTRPLFVWFIIGAVLAWLFASFMEHTKVW